MKCIVYVTEKEKSCKMEVPDDVLMKALEEAECVQSPSSESGYSSTNQEEQSQSSSSSSSSSGVDLCLVCRAAVATRHVHYGAAAACNSCRAFFRRAAQSGNYAGFACSNSGSSSERCVIRPKSWKSCQKCRFELCLQAGMKVAFVWSLEQRKIR